MALSDFGYFSSTALNFAASLCIPKLHGIYSLTSIPSAFIHRTGIGEFFKSAVKSVAAGYIGWGLSRMLALSTPYQAIISTTLAYEALNMGQHLMQTREAIRTRQGVTSALKPIFKAAYEGVNIYSIFNTLTNPNLARTELIKEFALFNPGKLKVAFDSNTPFTWTKTQNVGSLFNPTVLPGTLAALSVIYRGHQSFQAANELQRRQNMVTTLRPQDKVGYTSMFLHAAIPFAIDLAIIDTILGLNYLSGASSILTPMVALANNYKLVQLLMTPYSYTGISLLAPIFMLNLFYKAYKGDMSLRHNFFGTVWSYGVESATASVLACAGLVGFSAGIITPGLMMGAATALYVLPSGLIYGVGNRIGATSYIDLLIPDFIKEIVSPDFSFRKQMSKLDITVGSPTAAISGEIEVVRRSTGFYSLANLSSFEKDIVWSCMKTNPAAAETMNEKLARAMGAAQKIYLSAPAQTTEALTRAMAVAVYLATDPHTPYRPTAIAAVANAIKWDKYTSLDNLLANGGQPLNLPQKVAIFCANLLRANNFNTTLISEMGRNQYSAGAANENLTTGFTSPEAFKTNMDRHFDAVSGHDFARPELPGSFQR